MTQQLDPNHTCNTCYATEAVYCDACHNEAVTRENEDLQARLEASEYEVENLHADLTATAEHKDLLQELAKHTADLLEYGGSGHDIKAWRSLYEVQELLRKIVLVLE